MREISTQLDGVAAADTEAAPTSQASERARTLTCDASRENRGEAARKGDELVRNEPDTPAGQHGDTNGANAAQARGTLQGGRSRPRPAPLSLSSFVPRITTGHEGKSSGQGCADASTWPTFVVFTPTGLSAEVERLAQDVSADQETDSPMLPTMTDKSSEPRSSSISPTHWDGEAATGQSSMSLSLSGASANRKDDISVEGGPGESPQPMD